MLLRSALLRLRSATSLLLGTLAILVLVAAPASAQEYVGHLGGYDVFNKRGDLFRVDDDGAQVPVELPDDALGFLDWKGEVRLAVLPGETRREQTFAVLTPQETYPLSDSVTETWGLLAGVHSRAAIGLSPEGDRVFFSAMDKRGEMHPVAYDYRTGEQKTLALAGIFMGFAGGQMYYQTIGDGNQRTLHVTGPPYDTPGDAVTALGARAMFRPLAGGTVIAQPGAEYNVTSLYHLPSDTVIRVGIGFSAVFYDDEREALGFITGWTPEKMMINSDLRYTAPGVRYYTWDALTALAEEASGDPSGDDAPDLSFDALMEGTEGVPLYDPGTASRKALATAREAMANDTQRAYLNQVADSLAALIPPGEQAETAWVQEGDAAVYRLSEELGHLEVIRLELAGDGGLRAVFVQLPFPDLEEPSVPASLGETESRTIEGPRGPTEVPAFVLRLDDDTSDADFNAFLDAYFAPFRAMANR